jgi:hypothetical protein
LLVFEPTLVAYSVAPDLGRALRAIVEKLRLDSRDLADQIERAGTSLALNLVDGAGRERISGGSM